MRHWITPDPLGEDGGLNLYRFCENSPVGIVDKMALQVNR
ncbi:MAG: hypothetical protein K9M54_05320 [Kiritimatiellales bacterium]|nr:hypothetical protein [Kiritimatiellales bacterium]MCF7864118.1 hypothetical protein [Kiritimatiellales bacterium]